jgi:hypothetical protein
MYEMQGPRLAVQGYPADCPGELAAGAIGNHTLSVLPPVQDTGWKPGCPVFQLGPDLPFGCQGCP